MIYSSQLKKLLVSDHSIIGKERYLNSAVLIPILNKNDEEFILFEKRSTTVRQPGEISFPGGHFDPAKDESFLNTALRETSEELGISENAISILGKLGTLITPMEIIVESYVGVLNIDKTADLKIDPKEVDKVFLVPLKYFLENKPLEYHTRLELHPHGLNENGERVELLPVKELGLPKRYANPWTRGRHRVLVYNYMNEVIWGITAELIFELSSKLKTNENK